MDFAEESVMEKMHIAAKLFSVHVVFAEEVDQHNAVSWSEHYLSAYFKNNKISRREGSQNLHLKRLNQVCKRVILVIYRRRYDGTGKYRLLCV